MIYSNLLATNFKPLVLDNSVLVNLFSLQYGVRIRECIQNKFIIPDRVVDEFTRRPDDVKQREAFIQRLLDKELIEIRGFQSEEEKSLFEQLTDEQTSLGDGEAMTISTAFCNNYVPVIDENKGTKEAKKLMKSIPVARSTDILMHASVHKSLTEQDYASSVSNALSIGKMHVDLRMRDSIVDLIGVDKALECHSLPDFKSFKRKIEAQRNT